MASQLLETVPLPGPTFSLERKRMNGRVSKRLRARVKEIKKKSPEVSGLFLKDEKRAYMEGRKRMSRLGKLIKNGGTRMSRRDKVEATLF